MLDRNRQKACEPGSRFGPSKRLTRGCVPSFIGKGLEDLLPGFSPEEGRLPHSTRPCLFSHFLALPTYAAAPPLPPAPCPTYPWGKQWG